ncbi:hypothetical protein [Jeotgalibacillus terrae]|uniref:Uncharacterized protein n=1 Tax=Jeotgalibacillus terrae TaxID=587735 RepID=A0ABW5ZQS5_9BACL|nr:hypothetical protein [Jeotgalibacillus terrae]MBM7581060.1 hypothetical protein [Jeotgalibacillus terrae]
MKKEILNVQEKAKKYKKLFEVVSVNPYAYELNRNLYFQVIYKNRKGKVTGGATITAAHDQESEAKIAHRPLTLYCANVAGIYKGGKDRAEMSPDYLSPLIESVSEIEDPAIQKGVEKLRELQEWHRRHNHEYKEARENFSGEGVKIVTDQDLSFIVNKMAHLEVIHDEMLKIMTEYIPIFEAFRNALKKLEIWNQLSMEAQGFIYQLIKDRKQSEENRAASPRIEGDTYEERVAYVQKRIGQEEEQKLRSHGEVLRWPNM